MRMGRLNLEIAMVVIIILIVMLLSVFTFSYVESLRGGPLPDENIHITEGVVTGYSGVWYKFATVTFSNGSTMTFDGRGVWDAVSELELNQQYRFYWKWSTFDFETQDGKYLGKWCLRIENEQGVTEWQPKYPFVVHGLFIVLVILIIIAPIVFMYWNDARKKEKHERVEKT